MENIFNNINIVIAIVTSLGILFNNISTYKKSYRSRILNRNTKLIFAFLIIAIVAGTIMSIFKYESWISNTPIMIAISLIVGLVGLYYTLIEYEILRYFCYLVLFVIIINYCLIALVTMGCISYELYQIKEKDNVAISYIEDEKDIIRIYDNQKGLFRLQGEYSFDNSSQVWNRNKKNGDLNDNYFVESYSADQMNDFKSLESTYKFNVILNGKDFNNNLHISLSGYLNLYDIIGIMNDFILIYFIMSLFLLAIFLLKILNYIVNKLFGCIIKEKITIFITLNKEYQDMSKMKIIENIYDLEIMKDNVRVLIINKDGVSEIILPRSAVLEYGFHSKDGGTVVDMLILRAKKTRLWLLRKLQN